MHLMGFVLRYNFAFHSAVESRLREVIVEMRLCT
jgi:hypothetical protein